MALSGMHRKSAIRALRQGYERGRERRGRGGSGEGVARLRLQPFLPEIVPILEQHGELQLDAETR